MTSRIAPLTWEPRLAIDLPILMLQVDARQRQTDSDHFSLEVRLRRLHRISKTLEPNGLSKHIDDETYTLPL